MRLTLATLVAVGIVIVAPASRGDDAPKVVRAPAAPARAPRGVAKAPEASAPAEREVAEVRVLASKADSLPRVPGAGTVVTGKEIGRAEPVTMEEVLRRVPGVVVRQDYAGGSRLDVSIRGVDAGRSRRVLVLEDGIPIALNPYSEPDLYHAPAVEWLRGVEVVKGSGNVLFGPQTLAGTLNLLTTLPPDKPTARADLDVGTYGYSRALASYGDALGESRYVVQALHRSGDGFRLQPFSSTDGMMKLAIPTWKDGEAMVKLQIRRETAASDDVGLTRAMWASDPRRPTLKPDDELTFERYAASITHKQRLDEDTKLLTLLYAYRTTREWRRQDYTRSPIAGVPYTRIAGFGDEPGGALYFGAGNTVLHRQYDVAGVEPRLEHRFTTGLVAHTVDVGGRVLRETADSAQRAGTTTTTYDGASQYVEARGTTGLGAYVQDRIAFRPDLLVTPGVRLEHARYERAILRQDLGRGPEDIDVRGTKEATGIVPGVGIVYGQKRAHVFGGLHVGYAPPRFTSAVSPRGVPSTVRGDRSINYELGGRARAARWLDLEGTGFLSNFQNQVIANTEPGAEVTLVDAGATRLVGAEAMTRARVATLVKLPFELDVGARYTLARATFASGPYAGNALPYAPLHAASANVDVEHDTGLGGQVAWSVLGSQYTDVANTVAEDVTGRIGRVGARHIVDATLHYRYKPAAITFRLTVKNALDATYVAARRPEGIFPGPYRQVLLGVAWQWEGAARER